VAHNDEIVKEWNLIRKDVLARMLEHWLYPDMMVEATQLLDKITEKWVIECCQKDFREILQQSPYNVKESVWSKTRSKDEHEVVKKRPITMGMVVEIPEKNSWPFV